MPCVTTPRPARIPSLAARPPARAWNESRASRTPCADATPRCAGSGTAAPRSPGSRARPGQAARSAAPAEVSSSRVSTVRLRTFSPVASSSTPGALGERLHADRREQVVGGAELRARVDAAVRAAQPFAVEQVRAGELGPSCVRPRRSIASRYSPSASSPSLTSARDRARTPSAQSFARDGGAASMRSRAPRRQLGLLGPGRRLDQLGRRPDGDEQLGRVVAGRSAAASASP